MKPAGLRWLAALISVAALVAAVPASAAPPPTVYNVTTTADDVDSATPDVPGPDGVVSLREARNWAHTAPNSNYRIVLPPGHYKVGAAIEFDANAQFLVEGHSARDTIVDATGGAAHRVFLLDGVSGTSLVIQDVTITGGSVPGVGGGGVGNFGSNTHLVLRRDSITGNVAQYGGGVANDTGGELDMADSLIAGNSLAAGTTSGQPLGGGGLWNRGTANILTSTISGNTANPIGANDARGGGVNTASGGNTALPLTTVANNTATGAEAFGGNVFTDKTGPTPGDTYAGDAIVAGGSPDNCNVAMHQETVDASIDSGTTCGLPRPGTDPRLGPLLDNGGETATHALLAGSPAVDSFTANCTNDIDQRGVEKPQGPSCDVGAFEQVQSGNLALSMSGTPDPVLPGGTITYTIGVVSTGPTGDATQPTITDTLPAGTHFVSATASQGSCSGAPALTCRLGTLRNGDSALVNIAVKAPAFGTVSNTAHVTSPRTDVNPADDSVTATTANVFVSIAGLKLGSSRFKAMGSGPSAVGAAARGTRVSYRLSGAARVKFTVQRKARGRKVGKRCVKPSRRNRRKHKCTRYVAVKGSFTRQGQAGANAFRFTGRLRGRKLARHAYRLVATVRSANGKSATRRAKFTIVR